MLTKESLIQEIKTDLGEPTIKIEIDNQVWDVIINKAIRWFRAKKGLIVKTLVPLMEGVQEYPWPVGATTVTDVILPRYNDLSQILTLGLIDIVPADFLIGSTTRSSRARVQISEYVQLLESLENMRKVFGAEPDFYIEESPIKLIRLTQKSSSFAPNLGLMMLVYYKKDDISITDFLGRDEDLIYRYCLAKTKMILGTIRSKYSTYPSAGGSITMDGEALKAEAKEELTLLDTEIDDSQGNAGGIVTG